MLGAGPGRHTEPDAGRDYGTLQKVLACDDALRGSVAPPAVMAHEQAKSKDVEMKDAAPVAKKEEKVLTPEEKAKEALALLHAGA